MNVTVTGLGAITPIGIGIAKFTEALKNGDTHFSKILFEKEGVDYTFPIGNTVGFDFREAVSRLPLEQEVMDRVLRMRNLSKSASYGMYCALEAWCDAQLQDAVSDRSRVAIVSSGSNIQQADLYENYEKYAHKLRFLRPNYALNFFDTDIVGALSEVLGIRGEGHAIAAASASGNMGIIQGCRLINSGEYDTVIVVAPLMDLSLFEYQGFTAMGAMAGADETTDVSKLYRPFDRAHAGFVYGQSAACLVLESASHPVQRKQQGYGSILGYGISMDANRNPNPSMQGELEAMKKALDHSQLRADQVDYINTHGTGSVIGDKTEVEAIIAMDMPRVKVNSTKSLIGHGLSAAGAIEAVASLLQMKEGFLHRSNNLDNPIHEQVQWLRETEYTGDVDHTLSNSFGFGGINTSLVIKKN